MGKKKVMIHFVGTSDTVTVTGPWFDDIRSSQHIDSFHAFDKVMVNMGNVTYIEVVDDGEGQD